MAATDTNYITQEELKAALTMSNTSYADADIPRSIAAASRAVDDYCGRRFYLDTADVARTFHLDASIIAIDDLSSVVSVKAATAAGSFTQTGASGVDYLLQPLNAPADQRPYTLLRALTWWPRFRCTSGLYANVQITGKWGWSVIPEQVPQATIILATKLLIRTRQAPFGIVTAGGDVGVAMRIARNDPDVCTLLEDLERVDMIF